MIERIMNRLNLLDERRLHCRVKPVCWLLDAHYKRSY